MIKKPYLQFVRTFFIVVMLAGFGASNLIACLCAVKRASGRASYSDKIQKKPVKVCCKTVPAKKVAKKMCCKMLCCVISRKQDGLIETNRHQTALAAISDLRAVHSQSIIIPEKPFYRAAFAVPSAAGLCVFLC